VSAEDTEMKQSSFERNEFSSKHTKKNKQNMDFKELWGVSILYKTQIKPAYTKRKPEQELAKKHQPL